MKKFLALVLALVMTMSLVTISAGAEDFTDADKVTYDEAVDVMTAVGVVGGYADGSFNPTAGLTRGAAAKSICNMILGPTTAEALVANEAPYSDVPANSTFAGYIAYCANEGIISGYADGTFKPAAPLTGYAFMKMLLGALGYDAATEGYVGSNWSIAVAKRALNIELDKGLVGDFSGAKALSREEACLYAFNTLKAEMVEYDVNSSITIGDIVISNTTKAEGTDTTFMSQYFKKLAEDESVDFDALGRPAHAWKYDGEAVGTYADTADYVIENEIDADDFADLLEDLDVDANDKVAASDTANGKVIELFFDADDEKVLYAVEIEAYLVEIDEDDLADDKVSTKYDDRTINVDGIVIKGTDEKKVSGQEVDNFDAIYEAAEEAVDADETLFVLVILDEEGAIFSIEIPEIVEAKVTRVKDDTVTAGGEAYLVAGEAVNVPTVGNDKLWVGENGCVYKTITKAGEESEVVYLDCYLETTTDKWGNETYTAQFVNEEYEIVEWVVDADDYTEGAFYTYEINDDDEYELDPVAAVGAGVEMNKDKSYVSISGKKYFSDDMVVVFIGETGKDLEVTVKEGVQDEIAGDHYVIDSDDEVTIVYVLAAYESGESEDVLYFVDFEADLEVEDKEGEKADAYIAYLDGEEVEVMVANPTTEGEAKPAGFYTYKIDDETGKYTVKAKEGTVAVSDFTITQNKYITVGELDDVVVEGAIYDLTDEGLTTLKAVSKWDGDETVVISFLYDTDEECITVLYVDFAE